MPAQATLLQLTPRTETVSELIEPFLTRLRAQGRSQHTVSAYRRDLELFACVLPDVAAREVNDEMIDAALTDPLLTCTADGRHRSAATMHRLKATLRSFFAWAQETGHVIESPARAVSTQRLARTPPAYLTEAEKRRLLKELRDRSCPLARRDRVIFELFLGTGIRLAELVALDVDDVDLDGKHIRIRGKGNVPQIKFLKSSLRCTLRSYLTERRKLTGSECAALFVSSRGTRLCGRQIASRLEHWLSRAGVNRHLSPHGLRHTFATHLYASSSDLLLVKRALGHRDISTTEIYTHLADEALAEALERI